MMKQHGRCYAQMSDNDMLGLEGGVILIIIMCAEDLRMELWGSFLTVSGTRTGAAMGLRRPRARLMGAGLVLRRELDHGFFSATWRLPVSPCHTLVTLHVKNVSKWQPLLAAWCSMNKAHPSLVLALMLSPLDPPSQFRLLDDPLQQHDFTL